MRTITNKEIREEASKLLEKYLEKYKQFCLETGRIMSGDIIKADELKKLMYCDSLEELDAFLTHHKVCCKWAEDKKGPHGWYFSQQVVEELIELLINKQD